MNLTSPLSPSRSRQRASANVRTLRAALRTSAVVMLLALGACSSMKGAAVGAASGAAIGAGTGYGAGRGAMVGTGVGAAAGAIYDIMK